MKILNNTTEGLKTSVEIQQEVKADKLERISNLKVTTASGNVFDADDISRGNMVEAIKASEILGVTETVWKLADNAKVLVTVNEISEALALGIQAKGAIILE